MRPRGDSPRRVCTAPPTDLPQGSQDFGAGRHGLCDQRLRADQRVVTDLDPSEDRGSRGNPASIANNDRPVVELEIRMVELVRTSTHKSVLAETRIFADRDRLEVQNPRSDADPGILLDMQFPGPVNGYPVANQNVFLDSRAEGAQYRGTDFRRTPPPLEDRALDRQVSRSTRFVDFPGISARQTASFHVMGCMDFMALVPVWSRFFVDGRTFSNGICGVYGSVPSELRSP